MLKDHPIKWSPMQLSTKLLSKNKGFGPSNIYPNANNKTPQNMIEVLGILFGIDKNPAQKINPVEYNE